MKIIITTVLLISNIFVLNAQEKNHGLTLGFTSVNFKSKIAVMNQTRTDSESFEGFYVGAFKEFNLSDKLKLHPELQFAFYNGNGTTWGDNHFTNIILPVLLQYNFAGSFSALGGARFDYIIPSENLENFNKFGFAIEAGVLYDISARLFVSLNMSLGVTDRISDTGRLDDITSMKTNTGNLNFGFRF